MFDSNGVNYLHYVPIKFQMRFDQKKSLSSQILSNKNLDYDKRKIWTIDLIECICSMLFFHFRYEWINARLN